MGRKKKTRLFRLGAGDEWVLDHLAKEHVRFGDGSQVGDQVPLTARDASRFCADPDTVMVVAVREGTDHVIGFVYGGVLKRRHTQLRHICLYEIAVDVDQRKKGIATQLLEAFAAEARQMGIDRGFVVTDEFNRQAMALYRKFGAMRGGSGEVLLGLSF